MTQIINGDKYRNAPPRVIARVLARDREITAEGCWLWDGQLSRDGYPSITHGSRANGGKQVVLYVHRLVYMHYRGDPGDDMQIDHACHVPDACTVLRNDCPHRRCYNPSHLEAVTPAENNHRRGSRTICASGRGHVLTPENTVMRDGMPACRKCEQLALERRKANAKPPRTPKPKLPRVRICSDCKADISTRPPGSRYCLECVKTRRSAVVAKSKSATRARLRAETVTRRQSHSCSTCGADISHKKISAMYCEECIRESGRRRARERWRLLNWGMVARDGDNQAA